MKRLFYRFSPGILHALYQRIEASPLGYRLAKGAFWSFAGAFIARGLGLVAGIFVARILGKHDFGQFGMIQSTVGMFGILAGFGMGLTATKHVAEFRMQDPDRAGRIIGLSSLVAWATGGFMTIVLLAVAPWLATRTLASPDMAGLLRAGALLLLLGGVNGAQTGALCGFEAFKTVARVNLIAGLLSFPITVAGAWWWGTLGAVWSQVLCLGINCLLNYLALWKETARAGVSVRYWGGTKEWSVLWKFSLPAVLIGLMTGPAGWIINAMVANQPDGYAQLGAFNAILRVKQVPEGVLGMVTAPILPVLASQFASRDAKAYRKTVSYSLGLSTLIIIPLALAQMAAPFLTLLPYGADFAQNQRLVQWVMFQAVLQGLLNPFGSILNSMHRMWFSLIINALSGILGLLFAWWLVPLYGVTGMVVSSLLGYGLSAIPCVYFLFSDSPQYLNWRAFMPVIFGIAILTCAASSSALYLPRIMCLAVGVVAAFAMAALGLYIMGFRKVCSIDRIPDQAKIP